jgi:hypothetical protein
MPSEPSFVINKIKFIHALGLSLQNVSSINIVCNSQEFYCDVRFIGAGKNGEYEEFKRFDLVERQNA